MNSLGVVLSSEGSAGAERSEGERSEPKRSGAAAEAGAAASSHTAQGGIVHRNLACKIGSGFRKAVGALAPVACCWLSLQADSTKAHSLPPGVIKALAADEKDYCDQVLGDLKKSCHQAFRANLLWRELVIAPSGQTAFLVENKNAGYCGSAGCALYLFIRQPDREFVQVLAADGEVGTLATVRVLRTVTNRHYDIQKTWKDGKTKTLYRWDGEGYAADE